jgi:hypothetical protein
VTKNTKNAATLFWTLFVVTIFGGGNITLMLNGNKKRSSLLIKRVSYWGSRFETLDLAKDSKHFIFFLTYYWPQ